MIGPMEPTGEPPEEPPAGPGDPATRAAALASAARDLRGAGDHTGAEAAYREALTVLRDAAVPALDDTHRAICNGYAALLVELGRDRDAATLGVDPGDAQRRR